MDIIILSLKEKKEIGKFYEGFYIEKIKDETGYNEYCFDSYKILNSFDGYFYNIFSEKSYSNGDIIAGSYDIFDYMDSKKPEYVLEDSKDKNFNETIKRNPYLSLKLKNGYKNKFKRLMNIKRKSTPFTERSSFVNGTPEKHATRINTPPHAASA